MRLNSVKPLPWRRGNTERIRPTLQVGTCRDSTGATCCRNSGMVKIESRPQTLAGGESRSGTKGRLQVRFLPETPNRCIIFSSFGAVAQLGERRVRNAKVGSSTLLRSTRISDKKPWKHNVLQGFFVPGTFFTGLATGSPSTQLSCLMKPWRHCAQTSLWAVGFAHQPKQPTLRTARNGTAHTG